MVSDFENATAVGQIFLNTNAAAAAGAIAALLVCKTTWGKADLTMVLNGALAGLVAITADPLSPSPSICSRYRFSFWCTSSIQHHRSGQS